MIRLAARKRIRAREQSAAGSSGAPLRRRADWQRWGVELVVVFLGVFLAALADDWRERRDQRETARRLAMALHESFEDLRRFDRQGYVASGQKIRRFEAQVAAGERPPFPAERVKWNQRPPTAVWEAFLAADGAKLFPPRLVFRLAAFYNGFNNYADRTQEHYRWVEQVALVHADDPLAPYRPNSTQLKPEWRERLERYKETRVQLHRLTLRTAELEKEIQEAID